MKCPHCQKEFNAGKVMGSAKTPKKTAAAKKRGEWMKKAFANQKALEVSAPTKEDTTFVKVKDSDKPYMGLSGLPVHATFVGGFPADTRVMPKGSLSKEDLKAMISGRATHSGVFSAKDLGCTASLENVPAAPFDLNIEGEPHRVRQIGKKLMLVYLGGDGEIPVRPLAEGELESMWEKRIQ